MMGKKNAVSLIPHPEEFRRVCEPVGGTPCIEWKMLSTDLSGLLAYEGNKLNHALT